MTEDEFRAQVVALLEQSLRELAAICKRLGGIHEDDATPEGNGSMSPLGEAFDPTKG